MEELSKNIEPSMYCIVKDSKYNTNTDNITSFKILFFRVSGNLEKIDSHLEHDLSIQLILLI